MIAPLGHSKVTLMRVVTTPHGPLILAKEVVGRGSRYSDGTRLTLVEPLHGQRVARRLLDGEDHEMDDWLTSLSLADGKVQARYHFQARRGPASFVAW